MWSLWTLVVLKRNVVMHMSIVGIYCSTSARTRTHVCATWATWCTFLLTAESSRTYQQERKTVSNQKQYTFENTKDPFNRFKNIKKYACLSGLKVTNNLLIIIHYPVSLDVSKMVYSKYSTKYFSSENPYIFCLGISCSSVGKLNHVGMLMSLVVERSIYYNVSLRLLQFNSYLFVISW